MLQHPFTRLPPSEQKKVSLILILCSIAVMAVLTVLGEPLHTQNAPLGIVSFELAKTPVKARQMIAEWGATGQIIAAFHLGLDYLFLLLYSSALALGCALIVDKTAQRRSLYDVAGIVLSWSQFGAAGLDSIENAALMNLLSGAQWSGWPGLAWCCACVKFLIVCAGLCYIVAGITFMLIKKAVQ
ncbi:hypothetical protein CSA56_18250 [candidate division KSB3 bacterium]|uniref:Uncharacterized protein n=1 Tax=candidate division KSB3 bacterium TaxID=2044937 RepID=A0A2G6K705_9BACT|nr:MAG: hypothetical protein CSA56_18250 [candidate division KSB3 bacterium]